MIKVKPVKKRKQKKDKKIFMIEDKLFIED
jgi:hypothetical protein